MFQDAIADRHCVLQNIRSANVVPNRTRIVKRNHDADCERGNDRKNNDQGRSFT